MKNIIEILNSLGIDVGENKAELEKLVNENYKTINEFEKIKDKKETAEADLKVANDKITELGEKAKEFEGTDKTIEDLKNEISQYKEKEVARETAERKKVEEATLYANFNEATKDKNFINEYTKKAIFEQVKGELSKTENQGKGISEIFAELTKDQEGIFASTKPSVNLGTTQPVDTKIETTADYLMKKLYNK